MGYTIFNFGALYVDGHAQRVPQQPVADKDIPVYDGHSNISIRRAAQKPPITWIKPDGMNLLIADRTLLTMVSWDDLNKNGFIKGQELAVGGHRFLCRPPQLGDSEREPNEWDKILDAAGQEDDVLWHWNKVAFWGRSKILNTSSMLPIHGCYSSRYWTFDACDHQCSEIGFRPVLEILPALNIEPNCELDGQVFRLSSLSNGEVFYPVLQPIEQDAFSSIFNGKQIRMYTLLKNNKPVRMDSRQRRVFKDVSQLKLTDKYFGKEFLIPWVISNEIAVASRPLLYKND